MNRLWVRLALAFVLVTLVGVGIVAALANDAADRNFRQFLQRQAALDQSGIADELAAYYQLNGSWRNVAQVLAPLGGLIGRGRGMMGRGMGHAAPGLLLADANGRIVYDERPMNIGALLDETQRRNAIKITVEGKTVGYLVAASGDPGMDQMIQPAQDFLYQLRGTLVIAALVAGGLGIALGILLSRTLTAPLANLAHAAQRFAARDWNQRVPVRGAEEIAEVATAFNQMADELQRQENLRRSMIADIAHELRTPLAVMQGNLSAILDGVYPLERAEIATLYDETRLLSRLVDDLRELALADAGQLPIHLESIRLENVIRSAAANFAPAADAQGVRVETLALNDLPNVRADPDRVAQILRNLLANALRHTPAGGAITLAAEIENAHVRVRVRDTGEGIDVKDLPHVFERFYRADKARTPGTGSTGLGLAIAKAWAEALGGTMGVESERGKGSTFWFTLPIASTGL